MNIQDLIGKWIEEAQEDTSQGGIELQEDKVILYPPKTDVAFDIPAQTWPATYVLEDETLSVTFQGHDQTTQTLTFKVINAHSMQDSHGYTYRKRELQKAG